MLENQIPGWLTANNAVLYCTLCVFILAHVTKSSWRNNNNYEACEVILQVEDSYRVVTMFHNEDLLNYMGHGFYYKQKLTPSE